MQDRLYKIPGIVTRRNDRNAEFFFDVFESEVIQEEVVVTDHAFRRQHHEVAVNFSFQRGDEITPRQQPRNPNARPPKLTFHSNRLQIHAEAIDSIL